MDLMKDINARAAEYTPAEEEAAVEGVSTYTMLKMMGDKAPEETIKKHKKETKDSLKKTMKKVRKKMGWK